MTKKVIFLSVVLGVCLTSAVQAANIIWVSDDKNGTNAPADKGFVDLLRAQGYNVDYQGQGGTGTAGYQFWRTLDDTKIATLNASDLIILSRDLNSGDYASNATEVGQWNGIKKPLLMLVAHVARNDRWQWVETTGQGDASPALQAVKLDHPIFSGVTLDASNRVNVFTGIGSISSATSAGNGTLIATRADNNQVWIAEWKAGQVFKPTTTQTAGGQRMLFAAGATGAGGPDGTLNLTAEGQKMFLNAVRYLLGETGARYAAAAPNPADKATDVARDVTLGWTAGKYAATHDVYVGLSSADVNNASRTAPLGVLAGQDQSAATYAPAGLEFGQTYYWRVDEVNASPSTAIVKGNTWSFTVEPFAYPIKGVTATASSAQGGMGPENTVNGSGLNATDQHSTEAKEMWLSTGALPNWIQYQFDKVYKLTEMRVWNSNQMVETFVGFGAKNVTIEYSVDGVTWTTLAGVPEFAQAPAAATYTHNTTVNFGGVLAQYVKLTINASWSGLPQTGLAEVRFFQMPVQAREPQPASGATGVNLDVTLSWRPGREVASHKVYFGTDQNSVASGTAAAVTVTDHSYSPASLQFGTTYYWKVDEIGTAATPGTQAGDVWSFTSQEYAAIDDFESYNDDDNRIYDTWLDGLVNSNGSTVGYFAAPFTEKTIIHGGKQSMPFEYNNVKAPYYSEASRTFEATQNWTTNGADTVSLYFRGRAPGFLDNGNGTFTMSSSGTDIWNNADQFRFAYKSLNGDGAIVARVDSIVNTNVWAKGGVMIRQSIDAGSTHAFMPITPGGSGAGNGASFQHRLTANGASTNNDNTGAVVAAPYWVKVERKGNSFTGSISPDGKTWTALGTPQTIVMTNPVLIGLAVCSHDAALTTVAEISNVSTTGTVTGSWQAVAIGAAMPTNGAAPLYLTVQDKAGKTKTVVNPNPSASATAAWTRWQIPLSDLTGVSLTTVQKITLGVGDKASPKAGAAGILYFDDIGFGHSASAQ